MRERGGRLFMSKQHAQQDDTSPQLAQVAVPALLEQLVRRDQKISWINAEKAAAAQSFSEKEQALLNKLSEKEAILLYTQTQLTDREAQINEILTSRTWKTALLLQRIFGFLVPPQSRRARILRRGLGLFKKTGGN